MNLQRNISSLEKLVSDTIYRWDEYKDDFFIRNDPEGILKASFAIGYFLFVLEYNNDRAHIINDRAGGVDGVNGFVEELDRFASNVPESSKWPGFDYFNGQKFTGMVILKQALLNKSYDQLQNGMLDAIRSRTTRFNTVIERDRQTPGHSSKNVFKYTGYSKDSLFTQVFFYHSLVMFGWYMCYGYYQNSQGRYVVKEFPGSCNVQGCINMYMFKKYGVLDQMVYVPHGKRRVSSEGEILAMSAQRANGVDDVQFCHHGFRLANVAHDTSSGYFANHYVKAIRSHIDAFDVLTLTPIFRCIQRLKRTGKGDRVAYIDKFLDQINTDIKNFVKEHRMSNLPGGPMFMSQRIAPGNTSLQSSNIVRKNARSNNTVKNWITFRKFINYMNNHNTGRGPDILALKRKYGEYYNLFRQAFIQAHSRRNEPNISNNARRLGKKYQKNYLKL